MLTHTKSTGRTGPPVLHGHCEQFWDYLIDARQRFMAYDELASHTGMFFEQSEVRARDVTDGLSNTILMGEAVGGTTGDADHRVVDVRHSVFQNGIGHY